MSCDTIEFLKWLLGGAGALITLALFLFFIYKISKVM
jgi:hypothetical protein